jgi:6-phosphogluconolactonase/glucosamine-6-phosphate isomerase/deaminase
MKKNISKIKFKYIADSNQGAMYLGNEISNELNVNVPVLLFVSGGSALNVLLHIKSESFRGVTLTVMDERFGKIIDNNFYQIEKLDWSKNFLDNGGEFISTRVLKDDDQQSLADRFEMGIRKWISENKKGKIIGLFGMGADGHIAGIFPYPENEKLFNELFDGEKLVVSYDVGNKNKFSKRITTTNILFQKINVGFAYVYGQEKKQALNDFIKGKKGQNELPAMFLNSPKEIKIITDIR